jgi:hypothetical protein
MTTRPEEERKTAMRVDFVKRFARSGLLGVALAALAISGCAGANPFVVSESAGGKPLVWDCAMVQMSSPPKYGCADGKTYTAFQLRDFRTNPGSDASPIASK